MIRLKGDPQDTPFLAHGIDIMLGLCECEAYGPARPEICPLCADTIKRRALERLARLHGARVEVDIDNRKMFVAYRDYGHYRQHNPVVPPP